MQWNFELAPIINKHLFNGDCVAVILVIANWSHKHGFGSQFAVTDVVLCTVVSHPLLSTTVKLTVTV